MLFDGSPKHHSLIRRWFGDYNLEYLILPHMRPPGEAEEATLLFPEAKIAEF